MPSPSQNSPSNRQFRTSGVDSKTNPSSPINSAKEQAELRKIKLVLARTIRLNTSYNQLSDSDKDLFQKHYGVNDDQSLDAAKQKAAPTYADASPELYPDAGQAPPGSVDPKFDLSDSPSWSKPQAEKTGLEDMPKSTGKSSMQEAAEESIKNRLRTAAAELGKRLATWAAEVLWPFLLEYGGIILLVIGVILLLLGLIVAAFYFIGGAGFSAKQDTPLSQQLNTTSCMLGKSAGNTLDNPENWDINQEPGKGGCQLASLAMYYRFLGHTTATEAEMREANPSKDDFVHLEDTISNLQSKYGVIKGSEVDYPVSAPSVIDSSFLQFKDFLKENITKNGLPVVIGVGPGDWTAKSHYMVAYKYTEEGIWVNDPNAANGEQHLISWASLAACPVENHYYGYTLKNK
jgi:hypothetical protein